MTPPPPLSPLGSPVNDYVQGGHVYVRDCDEGSRGRGAVGDCCIAARRAARVGRGIAGRLRLHGGYLCMFYRWKVETT